MMERWDWHNKQVVGPMVVKERNMADQQSGVDEKCKKEEAGTSAERVIIIKRHHKRWLPEV